VPRQTDKHRTALANIFGRPYLVHKKKKAPSTAVGTGCNMTACSSRSRAQQQRPHADSHCSLPLKLLVPLLTSMQAKAGQLQPLLTVLSLVFLVPSSGNPSHQLQAVPRLALLCSGHLKMAVGKACEKQVLKVV